MAAPKLPNNVDSLPGCLGLERPLPPYRCGNCDFGELCRYIKKNFVSMKDEDEFLDNCKKIIHGENEKT